MSKKLSPKVREEITCNCHFLNICKNTITKETIEYIHDSVGLSNLLDFFSAKIIVTDSFKKFTIFFEQGRIYQEIINFHKIYDVSIDLSIDPDLPPLTIIGKNNKNTIKLSTYCCQLCNKNIMDLTHTTLRFTHCGKVVHQSCYYKALKKSNEKCPLNCNTYLFGISSRVMKMIIKNSSSQLFLDENITLNVQNLKWSYLHHISYSNNFELIEAFEGVNLNSKTSNSYSPILIATKMGNFETIKKLIDLGADVNSLNDHNENALHIAIVTKNMNCIKLLYDSRCNPYQLNKILTSPFFYAADTFPEAIDYFIDQGIDLNRTNENEIPPLSQAIIKKDYNLCLKLLNHGANPNIQTKFQPLIISALSQQYDILKIMLRIFKGDPNTKIGESNLLTVAINSGKIENVKMLIDSGAKVTMNSLEYALKLNVPEIISYIKRFMG